MNQDVKESIRIRNLEPLKNVDNRNGRIGKREKVYNQLK